MKGQRPLVQRLLVQGSRYQNASSFSTTYLSQARLALIDCLVFSVSLGPRDALVYVHRVFVVGHGWIVRAVLEVVFFHGPGIPAVPLLLALVVAPLFAGALVALSRLANSCCTALVVTTAFGCIGYITFRSVRGGNLDKLYCTRM